MFVQVWVENRETFESAGYTIFQLGDESTKKINKGHVDKALKEIHSERADAERANKTLGGATQDSIFGDDNDDAKSVSGSEASALDDMPVKKVRPTPYGPRMDPEAHGRFVFLRANACVLVRVCSC